MTGDAALDDFEMNDDDIEKALKWYEHRLAENKMKRANPYLADLIRALLPAPAKGTHRSWVVDAIEKRRRAVGLDIPVKFEHAVQSVYNRFSSDSKLGPSSEESLFYSPQGKGSGYWAVHADRALAWLKMKSLEGARAEQH